MKNFSLFRHLLILFAGTSLLFLGACGDDDNENPATPQEILTSKKWQPTDLTVSFEASALGGLISIDSSFNGMDELEPCERDDVFSFRADGRIILEPGANTCPDNPNGEFGDVGGWQLSADGTKLTLTNFLNFEDEDDEAGEDDIDFDLIGSDNIEFEVRTLNNTTLDIFYLESRNETIEGINATIDLELNFKFTAQ